MAFMPSMRSLPSVKTDRHAAISEHPVPTQSILKVHSYVHRRQLFLDKLFKLGDHFVHMEPYEVFVRWERGKSHQHAETVTAPDDEMALLLAKRNIDVRGEPVEIWVTPRSEITRTATNDKTLTPSTDREYRHVTGYSARPTEEFP